MRFVLLVESLPNWLADRRLGFSCLGVSDRRKRFFENLGVGDRFITYVTQHGFLDVREVAVGGASKLGITAHYPEGAWPWQIRTRPLVTLEPANAVKPGLLSHTKLCSGEWYHRFRQSGKLIDETDGCAIGDAIIRAAQAQQTSSPQSSQ